MVRSIGGGGEMRQAEGMRTGLVTGPAAANISEWDGGMGRILV